ncbi:hypothetical protein OAO01_06255 [Oligoflexia bacterium]|nr:hypothetical protein [Oligoflexia bacterium]
MKKICAVSKKEFEIADEELELYQRLGVPPPACAPEERARRRLAWRNERILYSRPCDATGKVIVSIFHKDQPFPVYDQEYWWSDNWDPLDYGRDFDFTRPFFEQFVELFKVTPQCSLRCPQSENSEFTNQCEKNKDCYLVFCCNESRECLYSMWLQGCEDCLDCTYLEASELCYEVLNGKNCYRCTFSQNLQNCSECHFCRDCIGCSNCIGCVNLRNKEYCFMNEKLTPEAYKQKVAELELDRHSKVQAFKVIFQRYSAQFPYKFYNGKNNEGSTGDYIEHTKHANSCFNSRHSEHIAYCRDAWRARNCLDLTETLQQDFCIELEGCYDNNGSGFCAKISQVADLWYCSHCFNSHDLFGCIGLKHHKYCIFNKEYARDEYLKLREKIVAHMQATGEWGEYFPIAASPFAYNESVAYEYFPMTEQAAVDQNLGWRTPKDDLSTKGATYQNPDSIHEVDDAVLKEVFVCEDTQRPYKLQQVELAFYRKLALPLPRLHHDERHRRRMFLRNTRQLRSGHCAVCEKAFQTSFAPDSAATVVCEDCYNETVE